MTEPLSATTLLVELRDILADPPSQPGWQRLCDLVGSVPPSELPAPVLEYALGHLDQWSGSIRLAPETWWRDLDTPGAAERFRLARTIWPGTSTGLARLLTLLADPRMEHITGLVLQDFSLTRRTLRQLLQVRSPARFETLDVSAAFRGPGLVECLAEWLEPGAIRDLALRSNPLSPTAGALLGHHPVFGGLVHLDLRGCGLEDDGLMAMVHRVGRLQVRTEGNVLSTELKRKLDPAVSADRFIDLQWSVPPTSLAPASPRRATELRTARVHTGEKVTFGGGAEGDVALRSPALAGARFVVEGLADHFRVVDQGSVGPFVVSGVPCERATIGPGDVIDIGQGRVYVWG